MSKKENFNVIILTEEINMIWNRVYSVNESISYNERMQLRMGFEDGINELFGRMKDAISKGTSKLYHGAKKRFDKSIEKGREYYEKGKKLAGDAWESIKKFADDVSNKIQSGFKSAVDSITSGYDSFKQSVSNTIKEASDSINQAYEKMKSKGEAFLESFKAIIHGAIAKGKMFKQEVTGKFKAMGDKITQWVEQNKSSIEKSALEVKQSGTKAMKDVSEKVLNIIKSGSKVVGAIAMLAIFAVVEIFSLLYKGVRKIGEGASYVANQVDEFIEKEKREWAESDAGSAWRAGKEEVYSENHKYIKTFENFKY
jgi:hypothetical protein